MIGLKSDNFMDLPEVIATSCCHNSGRTAGPNEGDLEGIR